MTRPQMLQKAISDLGYPREKVMQMDQATLTNIVDNSVRYGDSQKPAPVTVPSDIANAIGKVADGNGPLDGLINAVASQVGPVIKVTLQKEFRDALDARPRLVEIKMSDGTKSFVIPPGIRHEQFPRALGFVMADIPVYLHGPHGSGKTHVAQQIAEALRLSLGIEHLPWYAVSFGPASQMHELTGIPAINGHPPGRTALWDAWEKGGICLLDELDAAPELFVALNAGLANGLMTFADGKMIKRHQHCRVLAAGNTSMRGATVQYTSRGRQDAATIDRFAFVEWYYDEKMETAIAGEDQIKWTQHVQKIRKAVTKLGASAPDLGVSPRASINGAKMLRMFPDTTWEALEDSFIWRGATADDKAKVRKALNEIK